ncbi:pyruvate, phosphate dikinase [Sulfuricystis thermophila]|uniref:pyruvate, phosphate dikinase n=1 Tax=Sulfuricystis thermophila TaxID=2496847 RepID=UPI0010362580|nr:pyruvate, phosphate dikinase [Sulfuricystis thermophila]
MASKKFVYAFEEGDGKNKMLLGGKGANLCEMTQIGLNVPPGFTITTEACLAYLEHDELPKGAWEEILEHMKALEKKTGKQFGGAANPLLVSVRSGSAMSMPGMMDTILNLGLNKTTLQGLIKLTDNPRFGYDAYRRFIQLFAKIALGLEDKPFDEAMLAMKQKVGVKQDVDLKAEHLAELSEQFLQIVKDHTGKPFPEDPYKQLEIAIGAVFRSWNGKRAVDYRKQFKITKEMANGTACNIVTMVFGNMGNDSGTGVGFTRNPGTGENQIYGEYLVNAQGEDVVAGIRTPKPIAEMEQDMPEIYRQLLELRNRLEAHYKEVQDFEFTIERGTLYCLQTRNGKMNAAAMVRTSVDMFKEGLITKEKALLRVDPAMLEQLLVPQLSPNFKGKPLATGLPASPGAASGKIVFDADTAEARGKAGEKIILVREETKPEDIHGFFQAQGILTSRGGKTSHAAVVARGMGKPCVSGCEAIHIDDVNRQATIGDTTLQEGDVITIDGSTGNVYAGEVPTVQAEFNKDMATLLKWADQVARLKVMANADTPEDALRAREFGAMGIGLCRTERMFNATDRLPIVQEMILAETIEERQAAIDRLLPIQRADFKAIFKAMRGLPVTVRLMDPPLHEFLPTAAQLELEIAHLHHLRDSLKALEELPETLKLLNPKLYMQYADGLTKLSRSMTEFKDSHLEEDVIQKKEKTLKKVRQLAEVNPMLGHRGVRLGISYPEIYSMQIQAILEAAALCAKEGIEVYPEIMVPQVATVEELVRIHGYVKRIHKVVELTHGINVGYKFGSMLEVVRACLRAGRMAEDAEFFSFGTNDLTQATFSFSREDAENKFLPHYTEVGILQDNPFEVLDQKGVGELMKLAVTEGRKTRPELKVGICGEHGGHPASIHFCHKIGLTYVSCSGPRVPIARLAAAQAALLDQGGEVTKNA